MNESRDDAPLMIIGLLMLIIETMFFPLSLPPFQPICLNPVPPVIRIAQQSLVVTRGQKAVLQCLVESCPLAEQLWIHPDGKIINEESRKYSLDTVETYHFKVVHQLIIKNAELEDSGEFVCMVNNSIGEAKSSIKFRGLFEIFCFF